MHLSHVFFCAERAIPSRNQVFKFSAWRRENVLPAVGVFCFSERHEKDFVMQIKLDFNSPIC